MYRADRGLEEGLDPIDRGRVVQLAFDRGVERVGTNSDPLRQLRRIIDRPQPTERCTLLRRQPRWRRRPGAVARNGLRYARPFVAAIDTLSIAPHLRRDYFSPGGDELGEMMRCRVECVIPITPASAVDDIRWVAIAPRTRVRSSAHCPSPLLRTARAGQNGRPGHDRCRRPAP